jgi:hypothetical protein
VNFRSREEIANTLVRLTNAAFAFTEQDATAVATIHPTRKHVFSVDINGQEFLVTVTSVSP